MPALFFRILFQRIAQALVSPSSAGSNSENLALAFIHTDDFLKQFARGVLWVIGQVYGAKKYEWPLAVKIGQDLRAAQSDTQDALDHVAYTILPNSLNYLNGYVFSHGVIPLRHEVAKINLALKGLASWRKGIDAWRKHTVDPTLGQWRNFYALWKTWPYAILQLWHDWLQHPTHFASWADPPIAQTLPGYLAAASSKGDRDNLNAVLLTAWAEDTTVVQDLLNRWLLSSTT